MLTQVGPNRYADLTLPEYKHLKPWKPPAGAAKSKKHVGLKNPGFVAALSTARREVVNPSKSLPPVPKFPNIHPSMMQREANLEEFDALYEWMKAADAAPGTFTAEQREAREDVGKRVDLLRMFVWA